MMRSKPPAEQAYLAELAMAVGLGVPEVFGAETPTGASFLFRSADLEGRYDQSSGLVEGARIGAAAGMITIAWGRDEWFIREFEEMTPRPDLRDLRGIEGAVELALSAGIEGFRKGDAEVVMRLEYNDFIAVARSKGG